MNKVTHSNRKPVRIDIRKANSWTCTNVKVLPGLFFDQRPHSWQPTSLRVCGCRTTIYFLEPAAISCYMNGTSHDAPTPAIAAEVLRLHGPQCRVRSQKWLRVRVCNPREGWVMRTKSRDRQAPEMFCKILTCNPLCCSS